MRIHSLTTGTHAPASTDMVCRMENGPLKKRALVLKETQPVGALRSPGNNLVLSVPDLISAVKQFVQPEKHEVLDQMLQRYMQKPHEKQQVALAVPCVPTHRSPCTTRSSALRSFKRNSDWLRGATRFVAP